MLVILKVDVGRLRQEDRHGLAKQQLGELVDLGHGSCLLLIAQVILNVV